MARLSRRPQCPTPSASATTRSAPLGHRSRSTSAQEVPYLAQNAVALNSSATRPSLARPASEEAALLFVQMGALPPVRELGELAFFPSISHSFCPLQVARGLVGTGTAGTGTVRYTTRGTEGNPACIRLSRGYTASSFRAPQAALHLADVRPAEPQRCYCRNGHCRSPAQIQLTRAFVLKCLHKSFMPYASCVRYDLLFDVTPRRWWGLCQRLAKLEPIGWPFRGTSYA